MEEWTDPDESWMELEAAEPPEVAACAKRSMECPTEEEEYVLWAKRKRQEKKLSLIHI